MRENRLGVCLIIAVQKSVAKHIATSSADSTLHTDIAQLTVWLATTRSGFASNAIEVVERTFTDACAIINSGAERVVASSLAVDRGITDAVHAQYACRCDAPVCMESMPGSTLTAP